jgi:hypothetical protein
MVISGSICTRTAEEVAKLPCENQAQFAANVVKEGLCKDEVYELVQLYRSPDVTHELRRAIIESPMDVLPVCSRSSKSHKKRGKRNTESRIRVATYYAINLLDEIGKIIIESEDAELAAAENHLLKLRGKMQVLNKVIISQLKIDVSPGKQGGERND